MSHLGARLLCLGAFGVLAACAEFAGFGDAEAGTRALPLYDGSIIAAGPVAYCVETQISRPANGFAVLAACDALAGQAGRPARNGVITVQVGAAGTGLAPDDAAALEDLLGTASGQSLLSQTGDADTIRVIARQSGNDVVTVQFADAAPAPIAGLQTMEWRGFLTIQDRLTTISVRGLAAAPLGTDDGQSLLVDVITVMQATNGVVGTNTDS